MPRFEQCRRRKLCRNRWRVAACDRLFRTAPSSPAPHTARRPRAFALRPLRNSRYLTPLFCQTGQAITAYPVRAGTDGADIATPITQGEAAAILEEAFIVMARARAQIRRPLDSRAQVTISLVDTRGRILGIVRSPDAPIFGTDVSLAEGAHRDILLKLGSRSRDAGRTGRGARVRSTRSHVPQ